MRILLLYASAGGGHKRAAQAMEAYFREHLPGAEVRVEDALRHVGRAVNALCCDGYKLSAKHAPQIFGTLYRSTNRDTKVAALLPRVNGRRSRSAPGRCGPPRALIARVSMPSTARNTPRSKIIEVVTCWCRICP